MDHTEVVDTPNRKHVLFEASVVASEQLVSQEAPFGLLPENFSSLSQLLRVTAWLLRFVNNLKGQIKLTGSLSSHELSLATRQWLHYIQRKHFTEDILALQQNKRGSLQRQLGLQLDEHGLVHCLGRLINAELSAGAISPILLPKSDPFTTLVIQKYHKSILHSGTSQTLGQARHTYWIPQGRSVVKRVLRDCRICRRHERGPYRMPAMPPLSKQRVTQFPPFSFTGLDYLGPLFVKNGSSVTKVWVCLFTCMAIRAVHLELVPDMTTSAFLLCLRRFVARRGVPKQILSDNAPQFKAAKTVLDVAVKQAVASSSVECYIADQGIHWQFITQLSTWMGGFYERLVGLVKRCLRKSIGRTMLTTDQLQTYLLDVEAVINSQPFSLRGK